MTNGITNVYQFLSTLGDWKTKMDKDGNGVIERIEFRNFMLNSDFDWGSGDKNDLISKYWLEFDTDRTGDNDYNKGYANKNSLDSSEIAAMNEKIGVYQALDNYVKDIDVPNGVNAKDWKTSVKNSLAEETEKFIKNGGKAEDLPAYLEQFKNLAIARTTANEYTKQFLKTNTTIKSELGGYDLYTDADFTQILKEYIEKYINQSEETPDIETVKSQIEQLINEYVATKNELSDSGLLKELGYGQNEKSQMNSLQQHVLKEKLTKELDEIKNESNYAQYKEAYQTAIDTFLEEYISNYNANDYINAMNSDVSGVLEAFKASDAFTNIEKIAKINDIIDGITSNDSKLSENLTSDGISSISASVIKAGKKSTVFEEIKTSAIEKMQNGEFVKSDGSFDEDAVAEYIAEQLEARISEFYPNLNKYNKTLDDLNTVYNDLKIGATKETDSEKQLAKQQDAALKYCNAAAAKGSAYKTAVTDIFGSNYATAIGDLTADEIDEKIAELQKKLEEIDNEANAQLDSNFDWGGLTKEITIGVGKTRTGSLSPTFKNASGTSVTISSDHITYKSSDSSVIKIDENTGDYTITGKKGTYKTTISIMVNGKEVGTKAITVVGDTSIDFKDLTDVKYDDSNSIASVLAAGNTTVRVTGFKSGGGFRSAAIKGITNAITDLASKLKASSDFDATKVDKVAKTLTNYYMAAIEAIDYNKDADVGKRSEGYIDTSFSYKDADGNIRTESTNYYKKTVKKEKNSTGYADAGNIKHDSLGIAIEESFKGTDTYNCTLNVAVLIEKFASFYNALK